MGTRKKAFDVIICISDLQEPFGHPDAYEFLAAIKKEFYLGPTKRRGERTKIVNLGDEADFHNFSRFPTDPDGLGPLEEYDHLIRRLAKLWDLFPEQDVCISNHTIRPLKRAFQAGLPRVFLKEYHEFLKAPQGVRWGDSWVYNNIKFEHGENVAGRNAALNAALQNRMSTVIGHVHAWAGVQYSSTDKDTIFGMNVGCLIDQSAYAFAYSKTLRSKPTMGVGVILEGIPYFMPMRLDRNRQWAGKL